MNLYNFINGHLDQYLGELISNTPRAMINLQIRSLPIVLNGIDWNFHNIERTINGFFYKQNGETNRGFLYLMSTNVQDYYLPKLHYFECKKVKEGLPYVFSNKELVTITCNQTGTVYPDSRLDICGHCMEIFQDLTTRQLTGQTFADFILDMEESDITRNKSKGLDNYVTNWKDISKAIRKLKNFTCEKCGIQIQNEDNYRFMHAHHINGNKSDNRRANLQCLCIECHSQVDDHHRKQFSTLDQQRLIQVFREFYR